MAEADVTVIIPAFNPDLADLQRAIESAWMNRCVRDVVVVDDGSLIRPTCKHARLYYQHHKGVEAARNAGLRHTATDWVMILDQDDEYAPGSIDTLRAAVHLPTDYAYGDTDYVLQGDVHEPGEWHPQINRGQFGTRYAVLWHTSLRCAFWHPDDWINYPFNDWDHVLALEADGAKGVYVPVVTLRRYKRETGMMAQVSAERMEAAMKILAERWGWNDDGKT